MKRLAIFCFFFLGLAGLAAAQQIRNGEDLLRAMHDRYAKTWYRTCTFTQKSTTFNPDGTTKVETWYEAIELPAKLRIDIGPAQDQNAAFIVNETLYAFKAGKLTTTRPYPNILLILGFDVYGQDPQRTIDIVKKEGFDLTKLHEDTWEGKPAYVVGANKGDLTSKQFWIEKDRLLFVRVIQPDHAEPNKLEDIRFADYRPLDKTWIAAYVEMHTDGKKTFSETYTNIKANPKLDPAIFDPQKFMSRTWGE